MLIWVSACFLHIAGSPTVSYCFETVQGAALCCWQTICWLMPADIQWLCNDFLPTMSQCDQLQECTSSTTGRQQHLACLSGKRGASSEHSLSLLAQSESDSLGQIPFTWALAANSPLNQTQPHIGCPALQGEVVQVSLRLIPWDWCSTGAVLQSSPGSLLGCVAVWRGGSHHGYQLSALPDAVSPSSLLQHSTKRFTWTVPAGFMDVPLPWSKPEAFPQSGPAEERLRLLFVNTLRCCYCFQLTHSAILQPPQWTLFGLNLDEVF